jgi:fumarylacetoacetase
VSTDPIWIPGAAGSGFGSDHLPLGRFRRRDSADARVGVRLGDYALDLTGVAQGGPHAETFASGELTTLLASGVPVWRQVREWIRELVTDRDHTAEVAPHLAAVDSLTMLAPITVGDYVDFYASIDHASNVGRMFRPDGEPLTPNWRHLPISYHGRAGTVVPSGTPVVRPNGQYLDGSGTPVYGPSRRLDIEAELGFVVGVGTELGETVAVEDFDRHVFGVSGLNDWSARDIQSWEYTPLGPHLGKSFATSISTWITPLAALDHARVALPAQAPRPLPHLDAAELFGLDIDVSIRINGEELSRPPYRSMYWSPAQMLAHLTSNGASLRPGDLFGSGTISGPARDQRGSLLELSWNGAEPWIGHGGPRTFLEDGDEVVLGYRAPGEFGELSLGEVRATILPAPTGSRR